MSRPQRSLRLQRRSSDSLNILSGASGEVFFDADLGALRLYTNNNNDRRILADRTWVQNNTFDGNYNNLTNRPVIPTVDGLATETYVDDAIAALSGVDLTGLATETYVDDAIAALLGVDLTGYATETYVDIALTGALELYATEEYVNNVVGNIEIPNQNLQDLSNVTILDVSDGQVLKYNANSNTWVNASDLTGAGGTGISLSDLSVTVTPAAGNGNLSYSNITGIFTFTPADLSSVSGDVNSTGGGYVDNRVVRYNGTSGTSIQNSLVTIADDGAITAPNNTGSMIPFYYETLAELPVAANSHGAVAHAHDTGKMYYAHASQWFELANVSDVPAAANSFTTLAVAGQSNVVADSATDTLTLVAGTGISITTNASTDAITITSTGSGSGELNQNAFSNIAVSGQSTVEADSATDTLTLVAGTGISITTNASTDTVTITSTVSSGATTFSALTDNAGLTIDKIYLPAITMLSTTNNGASSYRFDQYGATDNPTVYAISGTTIAFNLNVAGHPFLIQTSGGSNYNEGLTHVTTTGAVTTGSSAQGKTSGTLYWKIPASISGNYRYICSIHGGMVGTITIKQISAI